MNDKLPNPEDYAEILKMLDDNQVAIRRLNDQLRVHHQGGVIVVTPGISGLGPSLVNRLIEEIAKFDGFNADNDPYGEHDCAVMTVDCLRIIWKIDYYDKTRRFLSPDATDPEVTVRVMTIMRSDEY